MSLLGRLEDLSLTDIVQIVFLSRRTGVLEIIDSQGRHTVLFSHGLVVNASSPDDPDLASHLVAHDLIPDDILPMIRQAEEAGVTAGTAVVDMNAMSTADLATAIHDRIAAIVTPLLSSRDGEFNFILSESVEVRDIEYEPEKIFKEGGIPPQRLIGGEGEKIKPLQGLEESMRAGKALLRGSAPPVAPQPVDIPFGRNLQAEPGETGLESAPGGGPSSVTPPPRPPARSGDDAPFDVGYGDVGESESLESLLGPAAVVSPAGHDFPPSEVEPVFPEEADAPFGASTLGLSLPVPKEIPQEPVPEPVRAEASPPPPEAPPRRAEPSSAPRLKIAGADKPAASQKQNEDRNVVLFERDPLVRVAAKRAFAKRGVRIFQFGNIGDARQEVSGLLREKHFFVTFVQLTENDREDDGDSVRLLRSIKKVNRHLPVVVIDDEADLRRRHRLLRAGADLYLTKPSPSRLQAGMADEELAMFSDELVLFSERAFSDWERLTGTFDQEAGIGSQFYEIAKKEKLTRSFSLLKQLINELSNPDDINLVSQTILRFGAEYLERGVLFMAVSAGFVGLGGFGLTGHGDEMNIRVRRLRIPRSEPSILQNVSESASGHRGKLRRESGNIELIRSLGKVQPTEVVVLPITHRDKVVGLLYGDNAEHRAPIADTTGLEIFLEQAGFAFENALIAKTRNDLNRDEG